MGHLLALSTSTWVYWWAERSGDVSSRLLIVALLQFALPRLPLQWNRQRDLCYARCSITAAATVESAAEAAATHVYVRCLEQRRARQLRSADRCTDARVPVRGNTRGRQRWQPAVIINGKGPSILNYVLWYMIL